MVGSVAAALTWAIDRLAPVQESARLDAELLLAGALGRSRVYLYAHPEAPLPPVAEARFVALVGRRLLGEPVAHLLGRREFWSLDLEVSPHTLIPRPETEQLVAAALAQIPLEAEWQAADLGTGTGAVAIALARERPRLSVVATDRSEAVLAVAERNVARLAPGRVRLARGDWWEALGADTFDVVVSNPPYLAAGDPHLKSGDVAHEPREALVAGGEGFDALQQVVAGGLSRLAPGGWLLVEHGAEQGLAVRDLFRGRGYQAVTTVDDMEGRERVTQGRRPAASA